jgi:hypothetical protein
MVYAKCCISRMAEKLGLHVRQVNQTNMCLFRHQLKLISTECIASTKMMKMCVAVDTLLNSHIMQLITRMLLEPHWFSCCPTYEINLEMCLEAPVGLVFQNCPA